MEEDSGLETPGQAKEQGQQTGATLILLFKIVQCNVKIPPSTPPLLLLYILGGGVDGGIFEAKTQHAVMRVALWVEGKGQTSSLARTL